MGERLIKRGHEPRLLAFLVLQQSLFLAAGIGLWLWSGWELADFVRPGWFDLFLGLGLAAGSTGFFWLIFTIWPALAQRLTIEQSRTLFSTERPYGAAAILIISASAGIGEEALFRGGVQVALAGSMPGWAAALLASAVFAVLHPGSLALMSLVAALGLFFGLAFHWSGSLLAVMIAHALHDIFAILWTQRKLQSLGHWSMEAGAAPPQAAAAKAS